MKAGVLMTVALAAAAPAQAPAGPLAGLDFLVGRWVGRGSAFEANSLTSGQSTFTREAGGQALLRRDHTTLSAEDGRPAGAFDQIMLIYADGGAIRADYADGTHVIHYAGATVTPGRAVTLATAPSAGPGFRLTYTLTAPTTLAVAFSMLPPGGGPPRPIATGTLTRG